MAHMMVSIRHYISNLMKIGLTFQKLLTFVFSIGNALKLPNKLGFWGILGVKTIRFIFLNPQRHILGLKHAFWRITRPNPSTCLIMVRIRCRAAKKMASGGHLGFSTFLIFHSMAHNVVSIRLSIANLMKIGLTVQVISIFVFNRKCTEIAPKLGFCGILGVKTIRFIFLNPPKAHPWSKARVLTYHSSKSVHAFDYGPIPRGQKMASGGHLGFSTFLLFSIWHTLWSALDSPYQIWWRSDLRFKSY